MEFLPIKEILEENKEFVSNPDCQDTIYASVGFYKKVGYNPPWICYYAQKNGKLVGSAAFKGQPVNGKIEIAYGTFPQYRQKGIGSGICKNLVELSLQTSPDTLITARTLPEKNFSTRILTKNGFIFTGAVIDPEDGEVWEWEYKK
ncbi:MAG: GNAT family N-acetyltransferase [Bacteroidia bacterium]